VGGGGGGGGGGVGRGGGGKRARRHQRVGADEVRDAVGRVRLVLIPQADLAAHVQEQAAAAVLRLQADLAAVVVVVHAELVGVADHVREAGGGVDGRGDTGRSQRLAEAQVAVADDKLEAVAEQERQPPAGVDLEAPQPAGGDGVHAAGAVVGVAVKDDRLPVVVRVEEDRTQGRAAERVRGERRAAGGVLELEVVAAD